MKINFPLLDEPLAIENATFLVLEDQFTFSTIVKQFYQYTDDEELKLFDRNLKALKLLSFPTPHRTPGISDLEHCPLYFSNYRKPLKKQL